MKIFFRKLFSPLLNIFEKGDGPYSYRASHRKILIVIGFLFSGLATGVYVIFPDEGSPAFLFPVIVFLAVAAVCIIVGTLGNDRAVANIWGNR
ncbi:MAG TPA: hypothetical protein VJ981_05645 [Gammaproteobacteria bacterium]|nr:hypothetical protein [Gammaproteobacteria bacterium]